MSIQNQSPKINLKNIFQIAHKEFADLVSSPLFLMFIVTYTLIILAFSFRSVYLIETRGNLLIQLKDFEWIFLMDFERDEMQQIVFRKNSDWFSEQVEEHLVPNRFQLISNTV